MSQQRRTITVLALILLAIGIAFAPWMQLSGSELTGGSFALDMNGFQLYPVLAGLLFLGTVVVIGQFFLKRFWLFMCRCIQVFVGPLIIWFLLSREVGQGNLGELLRTTQLDPAEAARIGLSTGQAHGAQNQLSGIASVSGQTTYWFWVFVALMVIFTLFAGFNTWSALRTRSMQTNESTSDTTPVPVTKPQVAQPNLSSASPSERESVPAISVNQESAKEIDADWALTAWDELSAGNDPTA